MSGAAVAERLAAARDAIAEACREAGRDPRGVHLVAVSKRQSVRAVREAAEAGQRVFGENYLQEAETKIAALADLDLSWHMIGRLQSNKARAAAALFEVVEGLDSARAARRLAAFGRERGRPVHAYVQVRLGGGGERGGVEPDGAEQLVVEAVREPGLVLDGVMGVAPPGEPARLHFERLRLTAEHLRGLGLAAAPLAEISAGMSDDFRDAIREGATVVRLGTAVFGPRTAAEAPL